MTRKMLRTRLYYVYGTLSLLLIAGLALSWCKPEKATPLLSLIPLVVSVPAAYLANCFQRRALFVSSLRALWSEVVEAKGLLMRYCSSAGQTDYYEAWTASSNVVDKVRVLYRNVGETAQHVGFRPFEPLMDMSREFKRLDLSFGPPISFARAQTNIADSWEAFRDVFLEEFDRPEPASHIIEFGVKRPEYGKKAPVGRLT